MKNKFTRIGLTSLVLALAISSCSKDESYAAEEIRLKAVSAKASISTPSIPEATVAIPSSTIFNDIPFDLSRVVEPSECTTTPFDDAISASIDSNLDALGSEWYGTYADMNFFHTITDDSKQYFGENGEYTYYVKYVKWSLERFWKMPNEVTVRGQHNATLNDPDKIVDILTFWYGMSPEDAEFYADFFINYVNVESTFLIESPLVSFDGFAIALDGLFDQGDLIVIGDGIVELAEEAGVNAKIVWKGIMAHEWGHQIQFNHMDDWYPNGAADNIPEATRTTELEADFFTGYYMTHNRGGTHNWSRTKQFLELFYNIGDCSFTSNGHHGTPLQRMEAAKRGYELGQRNYRRHRWFQRARRKHILGPDDVHAEFLDELDEISQLIVYEYRYDFAKQKK